MSKPTKAVKVLDTREVTKFSDLAIGDVFKSSGYVGDFMKVEMAHEVVEDEGNWRDKGNAINLQTGAYEVFDGNNVVAPARHVDISITY